MGAANTPFPISAITAVGISGKNSFSRLSGRSSIEDPCEDEESQDHSIDHEIRSTKNPDRLITAVEARSLSATFPVRRIEEILMEISMSIQEAAECGRFHCSLNWKASDFGDDVIQALEKAGFKTSISKRDGDPENSPVRHLRISWQ